ncbi:DUF2164 domain-containing protein [Jeotgalibacillus haloalkalitolerans]|uniref:DUF2164 domain-containing protein n=1 Tax=Jeotgalibacillus haloalkalitolerans TaxID=3104292 RepID=A0ABU5KPM0_9BACL|nr:DUF2164 domain-containing protein [Jeotgalibacillus sp. HH7-29]MDZ5713198.1 DUF2164 domain-containing protein [Jeotgalibacillus sp. HH7-29]
MTDPFSLHADVKHDMTNQIQTYFLNEHDEEIGQLKATLILDFFLKEIAPAVYNQGIADAHQFLEKKLEDLFSIQK